MENPQDFSFYVLIKFLSLITVEKPFVPAYDQKIFLESFINWFSRTFKNVLYFVVINCFLNFILKFYNRDFT